jgi:hypothetical protein
MAEAHVLEMTLRIQSKKREDVYTKAVRLPFVPFNGLRIDGVYCVIIEHLKFCPVDVEPYTGHFEVEAFGTTESPDELKGSFKKAGWTWEPWKPRE